MELKDRARSVNLSKLSKDEAERISAQIGTLVREMTDETVVKANRLLEIYGLEAKMQIVIQEKGSTSNIAPKKRGRPKKNNNL